MNKYFTNKEKNKSLWRWDGETLYYFSYPEFEGTKPHWRVSNERDAKYFITRMIEITESQAREIEPLAF